MALGSRTPAWRRCHAQQPQWRSRRHQPAPCQPTKVLEALDHNAVVGEQQSVPCSAWPADVGGSGQQQRWKQEGQGLQGGGGAGVSSRAGTGPLNLQPAQRPVPCLVAGGSREQR